MIASFGSKATEKIFRRNFVKGLPPEIQSRAHLKLVQIDDAQDINQLRIPPSNRLESLRGDYKGFHSIRINLQWRIVFQWKEGNALEVEIVDYH